jgi:hypothetical protein
MTMAAPTRDDAFLMVELAKWGTAMGLGDALVDVLGEDFDPEEADLSNASVRTILQFMESVATLTKRDLLSAELVNDWLWVSGLWSRVGPAARRSRENFGEPRLYENFEALANAT